MIAFPRALQWRPVTALEENLMSPIRRVPGAIAALASLLALALGGTAAHAANTPPAPAPGCFWGSEINATTLNVAFPNGTITNYWYDKFALPAGAKVVFHGKYPTARYMSLNSYYSSPTDPAQRGIASDALYDAQIAPDSGSANPFLPGAPRTDHYGRNWTATVSGNTPPADPSQREPNTLYAGTLPADQDQPVELLYRVYAPDKNFDIAGRGGLPQATVVLSDGTQLSGQAACDAVHVNTAPLVPNLLPANQYLALTHLPANPTYGFPGSGPQAPAVNPGKWYRPINPCHFQDPFFQAAGYPAPACPNTPALTQWPTKDNAYITSYVDRSFGPASGGHNVAVVTGKMPTTVPTYKRNPFYTGGKQMRYWGICSNESLVTTKVTVNDGCAYDEQIPTDAQGNYKIVVSTPADRPSNATEKCGVKWINWGDGDGLPAPNSRPTSALLIIRNLLPDPSFTHAAQNIPAPGLPAQVEATMGAYMPTIDYQSPAQFQSAGCK
ncbi:MAG TPA: hypothetical protein VH279_02910 [Solirubrobacteraceae bacterium]|jgi:hypothetical protein|nr:hypothetical protein [Solirubrobacteraceae bacterium]